MTIEIQQPIRKFRTGVTLLDDPDPRMTPEEALAAYSVAYPHFKTATLGEPVLEGDALVYPINKPAVTTKGGDDEQSASAQSDEAFFEEVLAWGRDIAPGQTMPGQNLHEVFSMLKEVSRRPQSPNVDPFLLPLA